MKQTLQEQIDRIKRLSGILNEQENATGIKSFGVQVDRGKGCDSDSQARQRGPRDRVGDAEAKSASKEAARINAQDAKEQAQQFQNRFNPNLDNAGDKLDREGRLEFNNDYKTFTTANPSFLTEPSQYKPLQRFAFLHKEMIRLRRGDDYWLSQKLNKLFNHTGAISDNDFYKFIMDPKIGGFDKFAEQWRLGFPAVNVVYN